MIRELRTLLAIAREGTFAAAGGRVGLTQAAVSAQMQRLEGELGFELFDRSARAARLNARGQQVVEQAQELMRLYAALGSPQEAPAPATRVNIGAIASAQRSELPAVLARFHRQVPGCSTRVVPGLSGQLADLVDAGELDLAIAIRPPHALPADLRWTTLAQEPFRLLVPRATKGRDWAKLLAEQPFVRYDRGSFGGRQVDRFLRAANLPVHDVCEVDELEAIVALVAEGLGVALLPQAASLGRWPAEVRAIDLGEHTFHREIGLLRRARIAPGAPADTLAGLVLSAYRRRR
ncbi:LysR substrate-binding domain-containing protein [Ramlibacter humi]|uniref:LysR family transcriptional regulator n=1 Tax=Ramlibacter humi TaxID=2530451 RepID=A0A4Z0BJD0_9BURK|nr:LysR substrate-binding domain-containing protein [Ramlibacter humi]TFY98224.1 LysR family transcriptional regulator [Ramlibacter humi]